VRVGVVANGEDPETGYVGARLAELGATFHPRWRSAPDRLADLERAVDLLLLLGSEWSVYDPAHAREIAAEVALVERATSYGCPVLGICFGGQIVAASLGLEVARAPVAEFGWTTIATDDPDLVDAGPWFQYHFDRWDNGPAIPSFARNGRAPQAVRSGRTLGLQFHPEVTPEVVERWVGNGRAEILDAGGDPDAILADADTNFRDAPARCAELVDAFLAISAAPATR
jgi:GMP synthase-like glutamine amidotransferase